MKSLGLICIALFALMALFSHSTFAMEKAQEVQAKDVHVPYLSKWVHIQGSKLDLLLVVTSIALCIKAAPRVIQSVLLSLHTSMDDYAVPIYAAIIVLLLGLPTALAWNKKHKKIVINLEHALSLVQSFVAVTILALFEEKYEIEKMIKLDGVEFTKWRMIAYPAVFATLTLLVYNLSKWLTTESGHVLTYSSAIFATALLVVLLAFDKSWRPPFDHYYDQAANELSKARTKAGDAYNSARIKAGKALDSARTKAGKALDSASTKAGEAYNYLGPKSATVPPQADESAKLKAANDEAARLAKEREAQEKTEN